MRDDNHRADSAETVWAHKRAAPVFHRSLTIQSRFLIGSGLILLFFCFVSALVIFFYEKHALEESAYAQTQLVMAAMEAVRKYVGDELRPKMYDTFGQDFFMMEAMSTSYVSRSVMDRFQASIPDFDYRRVSINARNPRSEANAVERGMIGYFRENRTSDNWQGLQKIDGRTFYRRYKPVYFDKSCMHCHGAPQDAPKALLDIYGDQRGFGRYVGELAGVVVVGIPVDSAVAMIREKAASVFLAVFMGASIFYIALSFFFNRVVVHNLHGLLDIFRRELDDPNADLPSPLSDSKDEIEALTTSAIILAERLHNTRDELRRHAQTLEEQVAQRTQALTNSKKLLQEKITTRNQELRTLNTIAELTTQATGLAQMLPDALRETLELVPALGAGIFLKDKNQGGLVLRYQENADCLPTYVPFSDLEPVGNASSQNKRDNERDATYAELAYSIISSFKGRPVRYSGQSNRGLMHIPLDCRGSILGVMTLAGLDRAAFSSEQEELLISIGRQIGIALESLNNLHQLMQSKELLQSVFDGITDLVVLLDKDCRVKMVNKAYLQRYDTDIETVLNRPCHELHYGAHTSCQDCGLNEVMSAKRPVSKEAKCATGSIFLVNFYPLFDENGQVDSVIRYARDITDQRRVEQKIQQTEKLVAMGQLAAGVAHEINNPLGVILCYVNLLKRQLADYPQGANDLEIIEKQTQNCKRIVTDLLQFARSRESTKSNASLNTAITEVVQMLEHQFKTRKIRVEMDLSAELPHLSVDVNKIKQVFVNLLMNAAQAVDKDGLIQITTAFLKEKRQVEIVIRDSGHGIPLEIQDKIFDPFFSTKHTGDGTGLGLSVSYGIIQEHGGEIALKSDPDVGATFIIRLPVAGA